VRTAGKQRKKDGRAKEKNEKKGKGEKREEHENE